MMTLGKNFAVAATLTNLNALQGLQIIERRIAYLRSCGEDQRSTVAWQDAIAELGQFERGASFKTWHLRTRIGA